MYIDPMKSVCFVVQRALRTSWFGSLRVGSLISREPRHDFVELFMTPEEQNQLGVAHRAYNCIIQDEASRNYASHKYVVIQSARTRVGQSAVAYADLSCKE
jgi:hypothetical protein